jgi:predicted amidohydrolase
VKIAVIEHRLRDNALEDARALAEACVEASSQGAEVVFFPTVLPVDEIEAHEELARLVSGVAGTRLIPRVAAGARAQVFSASDEIPVVGSRLGRTALLHGDACFDSEVLARVAAGHPAVLIMTPMSESDLQAEAVLELALQLSESMAGLVVVAEPVGGEPGDAGHGGSAIILLGEVLAESTGEDGGVLVAEVVEPVPLPEPPEPLPAVPTILAQRLATHEGRRLDMGYLADLTDGHGPG